MEPQAPQVESDPTGRFEEFEHYARQRVVELRPAVNSGTCTAAEQREAVGLLGMLRALEEYENPNH